MKKTFFVVVAGFISLMLVILFLFFGRTEFQRITGVTRNENALLNGIFEYHNIEFENTRLSESPLVYNLDSSHYVTYDLYSEGGATYLLIFYRKGLLGWRSEFASLSHEDGTLIEGWTICTLLP